LGDIPTTTKMEKILKLLSDGEWHTVDEIQERIRLTGSKVKRVIEFLKEYNLVIIDEGEHRIRLNDSVRKFLTQTVKS
jgi:predicted transcriptional regulator